MAIEVTDAMVEAALDVDGGDWRLDDESDQYMSHMRSALTAALALLPGDAALLWCCHVRGPDDLVACADYASALALADTLLRYDRQPNRHEYDPYFSAVPALWTAGATDHAEDLAKRALPGSDYPISLASWPATIPMRAPPVPPSPPLCDDAGGGP